MTKEDKPVSLDELRERGMTDRMAEVITLLIGEALPEHCRGRVSQAEIAALGYGPPCPCGERGLEAGEEADDEMCQMCREAQTDAPEPAWVREERLRGLGGHHA